MEAEDRYHAAQVLRVTIWGTPAEFKAMEPRGPRPDSTTDYDETGLAEELASLGFIEVPPDG